MDRLRELRRREGGTVRASFVLAISAALTSASIACVGPEPSYGDGGGAVGGGAQTGGTPTTGATGVTSVTGGSTTTVAPGTNGAPCSAPLDCNSFICVQNVCCATTCSDFSCESCAESDTGEQSGTCHPVLPATDPYNACPNSSEACDGFGECKTLNGEACTVSEFCISGNCDMMSGLCAPP